MLPTLTKPSKQRTNGAQMRSTVNKRRRRVFGTIKQRPPRRGFYVLFSWAGRRYERAGGPTREIAQSRLTEVELLLKRGVAVEVVLAEVFGDTHGTKLTFREAVPQYLEYAATRKKPSTIAGDTYRLALMARAPWAGEFLASLRPEALSRWATERTAGRSRAAERVAPPARRSTSATPATRAGAVSGATVNRDLNLGSALFRWAIRMGYVTENPFRSVERFSEKGRARETYLSATEARGLVRVSPNFLRPLVVAAVSTGMRRGELLALRWRAVDFDRRSLHVEAQTEKAGRGRTIPLTAWALAELQALKDARGLPSWDASDFVFRCGDGSALTKKVLRSAFESAVRRCDAIPAEKREKVTLHTLRHTAASLMVGAGVSIFEVAKILGHSTVAVTMRYAHFAPEAGRSAVERLGAALGTLADDEHRADRDGQGTSLSPACAPIPCGT